MLQVELEQVLKDELAAIAARRTACGRPAKGKPPGDLFGLALSGGGIRSATVSLGILDVLNKCKILSLVDYLSTVSGGGYIGGHVHAKLKDAKGPGGFDELFSPDDITRLNNFGYYLAPGKGLREFLNKFRLAAAYLASVVMNWVWVGLLFLVFFFAMQGLVSLVGDAAWLSLCRGLLWVTAAVLSFHFFFHGLRHVRLWSSEALYLVEALLLVALLTYTLGFLTIGHLTCFPFIRIPLIGDSPWSKLLAAFLLLVVTGFFANPNILTMHRFYRDRLAAAYLKTPGGDFRRVKLSDIGPGRDNTANCPAPYPLINTCLNVSGESDKRGSKSCDYFLLSPLYCGSWLTGYIRTASPGYKNMTLATAVAISGAAVNPNMGVRTNRALAFFMTLLDLRLGYWAANPMTWRLPRLSWWPYYDVMELFGNANISRRRVSITDGGHIENLGIYELLRRKCRLIIAVDASADPEYSFSELKNLVIRVRNELGLSITFRENPEEVIRPLPSKGFSDSHVAIADVQNLPGKDRDGKYQGLLVYVKSSLKATANFKMVESDSYIYKTNHPAFPHEPTTEQFFDKAQWRAYYNLGRFIAGDLLGVEVTDPSYFSSEDCDVRSIDQLLIRLGVFHKAG